MIFKYITVCFQLHSNFTQSYSDDQIIPLLDCNVIRIQQICCFQLSTELHDGNFICCNMYVWEICLNACHVTHCNPTRCSSSWLAGRRHSFCRISPSTQCCIYVLYLTINSVCIALQFYITKLESVGLCHIRIWLLNITLLPVCFIIRRCYIVFSFWLADHNVL